MRNSETGEFELVVGNRQLLSGFFIVVLLAAVVFSMGYILGRSSAPSAKLQAEAASPSAAREARAVPVSPGPAAGAPTEPGTPPAQTADGAQQPPADAGPQPTTQPAREAQPPPAAQTPPPPAPEAAPGSYWQVLATNSQANADVMLQTLKDKGFPASLSRGQDNLIHVVVGPYNDTASMGRAKTELERAGFNAYRK
jgi:cell division septation protein DedD